ncbi:MAG: FKBP-type peptidyl-prolyl cis-trans isomerase N-terminal domain-containing protein [Syntrophorhabdaceae bacterium]
MKLFSLMKSNCLVFIAVFVAISVVASMPAWAQNQSKGGPALTSEKTGYAIGVTIGRNMKNLGLDIDADMIVRGIRDVMRGQPKMTDEEIKTALDNYEKDLVVRLGAKNKQDGDAFLRENKARKNVITLPSGLQYTVLKEGAGPMPRMTDLVTFHYKAKLLDGVEFENTYWRNKPAEVTANKVIKGWGEALSKMSVGSIWRLYIPSELAYGEGGAGPSIGPNAVLVTDLELLGIR